MRADWVAGWRGIRSYLTVRQPKCVLRIDIHQHIYLFSADSGYRLCELHPSIQPGLGINVHLRHFFDTGISQKAKSPETVWFQGFRFCDLERAMGIEPTALAWEARVLPLYDARSGCLYTGSLG